MSNDTMIINVDNIKSVYNGRADVCCCGCAGTYSWPKRHEHRGAELRGHALRPEEISDAHVLAVKMKIENIANGVDPHGGNIGAIGEEMIVALSGDRQYIVYFETPDPGFVETHGHKATEIVPS